MNLKTYFTHASFRGGSSVEFGSFKKEKGVWEIFRIDALQPLTKRG